jgi:surfeit locus 1 family protein
MNRFPWIFTLLWLVILGVMLSAGFWQLSRAEEKRRIEQRLSSGQTLNPTGLADWQQTNAFEQVSISGRFQPLHFLLSNQIVDGRVGYFVFTAFITDQQDALLINRGWLADARSDITTGSQRLTLTGLVGDWPRPGVQLGEQTLSEADQQVVTYLPEQQTRDWLATRLCADHDCQVMPKVVKLAAEEPQGFVRKWQAPVMTPARHQAYAVQWFSMSAVLCLVWLIFIRKHYAGKN